MATRKKKIFGWFAGALALLLGLAVAFYYRFFQAPDLRLADLELVDMAGRPFPTAQLAGQPVVLNYWATWCTGCVAEFPAFEQAKRQQGRSVVFLMISDESAAKIQAFRRRHPYSFTFVRLKKRLSGVNVLPVSYFYNRRGHLVTSHVGELHLVDIRQALKEIE